jgi:beta-xylosidase
MKSTSRGKVRSPRTFAVPPFRSQGGLVQRLKSKALLLALLGALAAPALSASAPGEAPLFVPAYQANFPDPFILPHDGRYLAYATNSDRGRQNVQMASSTDLVEWEPLRDPSSPDKLHDAMPALPPWAKRGHTWAPEVLKTDAGYVLYFTARDRKSDWQCVGTATSADPLGPFTSEATEPLVCQGELGGTIDASPFRDADGQLYLYFKNDGNRIGKPTEIFVQRLSRDGLSLAGERISLLRNDTKWEAHVIEAPTMARTPGGYTMLFSANHFGWEENQRLSPYAMGYARCEGPMGPCTDAPDNPVLYSYSDPELGCLSGPGHQSLFKDGRRSYIAFHAWMATPGCRRTDPKRFMYIAPLGWSAAGKPQIAASLRPAKRN